ncbi:hypothetical protein AaE_013136 [Aphanomyces astaci]|uniref:Uncharacterized protein n=1 Tax=Aphanomyces astaci TaxID=112090 RepID=A0A6A4ZCN5_APHAT|nr:hypothetical protein AaE_013136 [Aphanomyces astaci]
MTASTTTTTSNATAGVCLFNDCPHPATLPSMKCAFHKGRGKCRMPDCHNQVYARKLCVRHGGKKICLRPHCTAHARGNAFCLKHGGVAKRRTCEVDGCVKLAHANHKCVAHGGGRYCKSPGCSFHARFAGLCLQCNSDLTPLDLRNHVMLPLDDVDFSILQVLAKEFTSKRVQDRHASSSWDVGSQYGRSLNVMI